MLPKLDGPTSVKRIKLPEIKKEIFDLDEIQAMDSEETQTTLTDNETVETTTSTDSIICGSYGSSLDLGYASNEGSVPNDFESSVTESQANGFSEIAPDNEFCGGESFRTGDHGGAYDYDSILFQFDTFFRGKLDAELASFQENMHSMLTEQQIHLRKIISSASQDHVFEVNTEGSAESEETSINEEPTELRCFCQEAEKKAKNSVVIELLSLSCQLTELLGQQKFKSSP